MQVHICRQIIFIIFPRGRKVRSVQAHYFLVVQHQEAVYAVFSCFFRQIYGTHFPVAQLLFVVGKVVDSYVGCNLHARLALYIVCLGVDKAGYVGHIWDDAPELGYVYLVESYGKILLYERVRSRI